MGAAGAQNEHSPVLELHTVCIAQVGEAGVIGVVAVEQAVPVDDGVYGVDGPGVGVDVGAVLHDHQLIGDSNIDGPELPPGHKSPDFLFRGQGAQVVPVAAEHLVDDLE